MPNWTKPLTLDQMLELNVRLPACPATFARLSEIVGRPDGHGDEVVRVVSTDSALTTQVLRIANSAIYGLTRRIRSVEEATLRLGFSEIWSIANALKGKELFQNPGGTAGKLQDRLWRHSLTTAILARAFGKRLNAQFTDAYFTAGILHDFAKLALCQLDPQYTTLCKNGELTGQALVAVERERYGTPHAILGGELLRHWNIPNTIAMLVMEHHDVVPDDDRLKHVRELLSNSDTIAHSLTALCGDGALTFNKTLPKNVLASVKMEANDWMPVSAECERQLKALSDI